MIDISQPQKTILQNKTVKHFLFSNFYKYKTSFLLKFLFLILVMVILLLFRNTFSENITELFSNRSRSVAFVRNGDIWISDIDGSNQHKIAKSSHVKYNWQHPMSTPEVIDVSDKYNSYPKLSSDGRYLSYLSFTKESLKRLEEREKRISTESAKIKTMGSSEIFTSPGLEYELKIYDIRRKDHIEILQDEEKNKALVGCYDCFNSITWAKHKNVLSFINKFKLVRLNISGSEMNYNIGDDFCWTNCANNSPETPIFTLDSKGEKIASNYSIYKTPRDCNNTVGELLLTINFNTNEIKKERPDDITCKVSVGNWYKNSNYYISYKYQTNYSGFYKESFQDPNHGEKLFPEMDYLFGGPILLSASNKFLAYPLGEWDRDDKRDLRIINLQNNESRDILELVNNDLGMRKRIISYPKWDQNKDTIYFVLSNGGEDMEKIGISFDVNSKKTKILIKNPDQLDVN